MRDFIIFFFTLSIFYGCTINSNLDYARNISDFEVKKIVKEVLSSQNTIGAAGLITSDGLSEIAKWNKTRDFFNDRYTLQNDGYASITLNEDDFSLTFSANESLNINYYDCAFKPYYYDQTRLNGIVDITLNHDLYDYQNRLLDFSVRYLNTYLYTDFGEIRINGSMGVRYDYDHYQNLLSVLFLTNTLSIESDTFTNISLDFTMNTDSYIYDYKYSGTLYNEYLGNLTFFTPVNLVGYKDKNPYSGRFKILNDYIDILVIVLDDYYVDIIVREKNDAFKRRTIHTTWINLGL